MQKWKANTNIALITWREVKEKSCDIPNSILSIDVTSLFENRTGSKLFSQFLAPSYLYMNSAPTLLPLVLPVHEQGKKKKKTNTIWRVHKRILPSPSSLDVYSNSHCQHSNSILMFPCCKVQLLSFRWLVLLPGFNTTQGNCHKSCQIQRGGWEDERMHQGCRDRLMWCVLLLFPHPHGQCDRKWELIFPACSDPNTGLAFL